LSVWDVLDLIDSDVILGLLSKEGLSFATNFPPKQKWSCQHLFFYREATRRPSLPFFNSPSKREGPLPFSHCFLDVCLNDMGKFWKRTLPEVDLFVGTGAFQTIPNF